MAAVSYDAVFLRGALAPFDPSGWVLLAVAVAVSAAGPLARPVARGRALSFAIGFALAYLLENLYATGIGAFLLQHRLPAALALAAVLLLEGLSVIGVRSLWAVIRGRGGDAGPSATDNITAAVLGGGMAFAASLAANAPALSRAAELADAGRVTAGATVVLCATLGMVLSLLVVLHLLQLLWERIGHEASRTRVAGAAMVMLAVLIALRLIG